MDNGLDKTIDELYGEAVQLQQKAEKCFEQALKLQAELHELLLPQQILSDKKD